MSISNDGRLEYSIPFEDQSPTAMLSLVDFLKKYYFTANEKYFSGPVGYSRPDRDVPVHVFSFSVKLDPGTPFTVTLSISANAATVSANNHAALSDKAAGQFGLLAEGIEVTIRTFLISARRTSAYFILSGRRGTGMELPAAQSERPGTSLLRRIMRGNAMNLFLFFLIVSFIFVIFLGDYALVAVIALQTVFLFFSDRVALAVGSIRPSKDNPDVMVISIQLTQESAQLLRKERRWMLMTMRNRLQSAVFSGASEDSLRADVREMLGRRGIVASDSDIRFTLRHVYSIVESAAGKFHYPTPKVVIANTPADNASAMGISPGLSTITITAGALEDLDDDELESVVGHEVGHIKGRDPVLLFALTSIMYIGGFYFWIPLLLFLGFFYFILAFGIVFLFGKFLETRADTESANCIGKPEKLASALTGIGFRQLYYERYSTSTKVIDWLRFDPHPPTYFRVQRLYTIASKHTRVRHTLLVSTRDCIAGFFRAIAGT